MFARFKIDKSIIAANLHQADKNWWNEDISRSKAELRKILLGNDGVVDGEALKSFCFPTNLDKEYDIFISHSHEDEPEALALAAHLYFKYGCNCFVDSLLWNNVYEILEDMDKIYCENKGSNPKTYNYRKRNYTTLHAYTMLSMSLLTMIQKAECFILIGNGGSIDLRHIKEGRTISPWVYQELSFVNNLPHPLPSRLEDEYKDAPVRRYFSQGGSINENFVAQYSPNIAEFKELTLVDINQNCEDWLKQTYVNHQLIIPKDVHETI